MFPADAATFVIPKSKRPSQPVASWAAWLERWHGSLKSECIRPSSPATKEEPDRRIAKYVSYYNTVRLHSVIGTITPADCLAGLSEVIGKERDRKREAACKLRKGKRAATKQFA